MATMQDVADRAGVSVTTVSHIINNTRYVSDAVRERVTQAINDLEYRPHGVARSLRTKRTETVGVIIPDNTNPYFAEMARFIEDACFAAGHSVIVCNSEQNPEKELVYIHLLQNKGVDGIVFVSTGSDEDAILTLSEQNVPVVLVDREILQNPSGRDVPFDAVVVDNKYGAYLMTRHLLSLGHRRIGCIHGPVHLVTGSERLSGYRRALLEAEIGEDAALIREGDFQVASGSKAFQEMVGDIPREDMPTAIFACNDLMAMGAIHAADVAGFRVPEDISVAGFDDIQLSAYYSPSITTVKQPKDRLASRTVELLMERIRHTDKPPHKETVTPSLVVRNSCRRVGGEQQTSAVGGVL